MSNSSGSGRSLCSNSSNIITAQSSQATTRKKAAHWTVKEETAFLGFLQGKLSKFSNGNFRKPAFTAATNFQMAKFPLHSINGEMAGEKTSETCNHKFKSFKQSYHAVVDLKNASMFIYCDKLGAGIMDDMKEIWT
ncbi:hypothetical protein PAXRUDRAFT_152764 [Paxillus rubicundulus Ve08.2h10]|uniref:Myb/SANT-like domain-containing protein n=1 Tax=Paxillus rubicundulus Ve08.2h10 TaxID=930991 RepID=A0A0D0D8B9_9AGAM|nr:hypothetical protein PAXRUDRAFT_152764 [Paxillus rubicundulus Ve08.2h10]